MGEQAVAIMDITEPIEAPQETIARLFMDHKGYPDARPFETEKVADQPCWYFYYELPEGELELEVFYDKEMADWATTVTGFVTS
jgi:uncharacterized protein (DUF2141 family)